MISKKQVINLSGAFGMAVAMAPAMPVNAFAANVKGCRLYESGEASWYGEAFRGKPMKNRKPFNPDAITAAHQHLPMGTVVRVVAQNGNSLDVPITDRGPYANNRILDGSEEVAYLLGYREAGHTQVKLYLC